MSLAGFEPAIPVSAKMIYMELKFKFFLQYLLKYTVKALLTLQYTKGCPLRTPEGDFL